MISGIVQRNLKNKVLKSTIKEEDVKDVLREIRIALLDADVNILCSLQTTKGDAEMFCFQNVLAHHFSPLLPLI